MATWDEVRRIALALPETEERVEATRGQVWFVKTKRFVWQRPLRPSDIEALGADAPTGEILCVSTPDEETKRALVSSEPGIFFTTPHFDGYAAVLVRLEEIDADFLREIVTEAWLCRAPKRVAAEFEARS